MFWLWISESRDKRGEAACWRDEKPKAVGELLERDGLGGRDEMRPDDGSVAGLGSLLVNYYVRSSKASTGQGSVETDRKINFKMKLKQIITMMVICTTRREEAADASEERAFRARSCLPVTVRR